MIFFLQGQDRAPHVFVRAFENSIQPWAAYRGVHELVIKRERENDAILKLTRWSNSERRSKLWARLQFATWEGGLSPSPPPSLITNRGSGAY